MNTISFNSTYQSSYNNPQFQQQFPPSQYGSIYPNQHYSSTYQSQPQFNQSSIPPSYLYQSQMNHQTSSVPQIGYQLPQVTTQPMTESPFVDSGFAWFPVFSLEIIQLLGRQCQSYYGTGYKSNATSSGGNNASGQARVVKCYNYQGEGPMARQCIQLKRPRNAAWYKDNGTQQIIVSEAQDLVKFCVIEQMSEQMINHVNNWEKANKEHNNESVTAELERYKERVKTFEQRLNIDLSSREKMIDSQMDDMIKEKLALKEQVDSLEQNLSKQIKEKECLLQTFNVFKSESKEKEDKYMENEIDLEKKIKELDNILFKVGQSAQTVHMLTKPQAFYDNIHKQALGYQNLFYLKKARRIKPTLYDGIVISAKHVDMPVINDEETLILEEDSQSKMSEKEKDPKVIKQNISHKPIDYEKLNRLSDDFGKCFTPQQELSAKQAFWLRMSNPTSKPSDASPVKIEAPKVLPKVSLVNESLKKIKFHLARFDNVVKIRTTPDARSSKKAKIVESKNANHSEPNHTWGSNATDILSSSSFVMTGCPDCSLVSELRMLETHDREPLSAHELSSLKNGLARGKSRLKFQKDHLCSACALGKSKKYSHQPKAKDTNQEKLYLLHMELCGPTRVASINRKRAFGLHSLTPTTSSSGLALNPVSQQPFSPVQEAVAPRAVVLADSPVSTSFDQDAPSSSTPSTQEQEQSPNISQGFKESPKTPIFCDDPLNESPHKESTSQGSSSNVRQTHTPFEHLSVLKCPVSGKACEKALNSLGTQSLSTYQEVLNYLGDKLVAGLQRSKSEVPSSNSSVPVDNKSAIALAGKYNVQHSRAKHIRCSLPFHKGASGEWNPRYEKHVSENVKASDRGNKHDVKALDDALVAYADHLEFGKCNMRLNTDIKPKEATFQVVLDALALTPFYRAFLITADVPFCPKIPGQKFEDLPLEHDILSFIRDLGHTRDTTYLTDVNVLTTLQINHGEHLLPSSTSA
ncbi:hypothetical protein Tco_0679491 [Tanacetum coccineum]|uniref:Uncharacterized protein n=1 Tax=Tanacetum coccineum TaxID=301880 RepID=A0ABQ4XIP0_9ASTR